MSNDANHPSVSRRQFMQSAAALGAAAAVWPGTGYAQQNGKLRHASIGVGGMGRHDLREINRSGRVEIVALCDIDENHLNAAADAFPDARVYRDWRELLDQEQDRIDSVNVTVPDHMHAAITVSALRRGKHVYCQKPLCHDVSECRAVASEAERAGTVTQMGTQHASSTADRTAERAIQAGAIGKATAVYAWSNKPTHQYRPTGPRAAGAEDIPAHVDWDKWLGTAPERPYKHGVYHPTWWRGWQDFGVGWLGDMGCHIMDMPYRALRLTAPTTITADVETAWRDTPARFTETWPTAQVLSYTFPGTRCTAEDELPFIWSDGDQYPPGLLRGHIGGADWPTEGALVIGTAGTLLLQHGSQQCRLFVDDAEQPIDDYVVQGDNHWHQWVCASLGDGETRSPAGYAAEVTQSVLLGTIALRRPDRGLAWDHDAMRFTNDDPANALLARDYRAGWEVDGLGRV